MTNTKTQFILHKFLLVAFISVCILSTAASCSSNATDKTQNKATQISSLAASSSLRQETSTQSKSSLLGKIKDKFSRVDLNKKSESGTLDQRIEENAQDEGATTTKEQEITIQKPLEIQTHIQPSFEVTEVQKQITVDSQLITEKRTITPIISQTPPKEIISQTTISSSEGTIKKSKNNICHSTGMRDYNKTIYFTLYLTEANCIASGARMAMR